jgi:hypothetical protein
MSEHNAPQPVIDVVTEMPDHQTFQHLADLAAALGVPTEKQGPERSGRLVARGSAAA